MVAANSQLNIRNQSAGPRRSSSLSNGVLMAVLVLAAAIPYLNSLLNGFVYDDTAQVLNNPYILNFHHVGQIFTTGVWSYVGKQGVTNYYRPLMTFGYLICHELFGRIAFGYHLVNLGLHIATVCVLFGLTLALFRRRDVAFLAALIFALHPVHTESVAWIAGVTDLELAFFCVLAFWLYVMAARPGGRRSEGLVAAMAVCFILALLSKEQALVLPLLATLYEHGYREDRGVTTAKQKLARYDVLWLLAAAYLLLRIRILGAFAPTNHAARLTWAQAFLSAPALVGHYVAKLFWPWTLSAFYVFHKSTSPLDLRVLAGLAVLVALAAGFRALLKRNRVASFGILWFLATLAPVLNARWMAANVFAERYLYLPSIGFCWVAAVCAVALWTRLPLERKLLRAACASAFVLLMALFAARIFFRDRDWSNNIRLYTRTLEQQPRAYPILNNLGTVYWRHGEIDPAKREWDKAYRVRPDLAPLLNNLGMYYAREGDEARAVSYYQRAMRLKPAYGEAHINLGIAYEKMERPQAAVIQLRDAVMLSPLSARAHMQLGKLYLESGQDLAALRQFREAEQSQPSVEACDSMGTVYLHRSRAKEAVQAFQRALALNPFDSVAHFNLAGIDEAAGRSDLAGKEYRAGLETDPKNADALAALKKLHCESVHEK